MSKVGYQKRKSVLGLQDFPANIMNHVGSFLDNSDSVRASRLCKTNNEGLSTILQSITVGSITSR